MPIKIYNTLTQKKETFVPIEEGKVKMYVCGPTVYNYIHIGNARPAIVFDTVRRYLEYRGYEVNYISNFTDVDDKIIRAANEQKEDVFTLAERYIQAYFEDITALGCKHASHHPRVTENMNEIIDFVQGLIDKGYAYESDGDVYFKTKKFAEYGKLSHQSIDDLHLGARIEVGEKKQDPLDFALWKAAKPGEVYWDSPWGEGRPGWHIECSAMARKYLGDTIDIHAGGQDLSFPHHENEIAQTESLTGKPFANYWMHNGYININNEKMSKSLGNFVLVHEIIKKHDPNVLRFFMLSVHYRHPINYSNEVLNNAKSSLERLQTSYSNLKYRLDLSTDIVLFELAKSANYYLMEKTTSTTVIKQYMKTFEEYFDVLGVSLEQGESDLLDEEIEQLITKRNEARKNRDFKTADEIRDKLKALNIVLEDTPQGTRWKRG